MELTIKTLHTFDSMKLATLLAGHGQTDNVIKSIMVLEHIDIEKWLTPGQVLLSSLYGLAAMTDNELDQFIKKLVEFECAGLIIKSGRLSKIVPQTLVISCNKHGLPLFEITDNMRYHDIMIEVTQHLMQRKTTELDFFYQSHYRFMKIMKSDLSFTKILTLLQELLKRDILFENMGSIIFSSMEPVHYTRLKSLDNLFDDTPIHFKRTAVMFPETNLQDVLISLEIYTDSLTHYQLYIRENGQPLTVIETQLLINAYHILRMHALNESSKVQSQHHLNNDYLDLILFNSTATDSDKLKAFEQLKLNREANYRLVQLMLHKKIDNYADILNLMQHLFRTDKPNILCKALENGLIFIVPITTPDEYIIHHFKESLSLSYISQQTDVIQNLLISNLTTPTEFPKAIDHLQKMNETIKQSTITELLISESDLALPTLILRAKDSTNLKDLIPGDLYALYTHHPDLYLTLVNYLKANQNAKSTAEAIFVHPKTVTYRLKKITELLHIDYADGDNILKYTIGTKLIDQYYPLP